MDYRAHDPNWDKNLQKLGGSFLQSTEWASFQEALGRDVVHASGEGWQWLAAVRGQKGLKYLLCSYGPTAKDAKSARAALKSLLLAGQELDCDFVRVEPQAMITAADLQKLGAVQIGEVQPTHTQVIDLRLSIDDLRKGLKSGHRNPINTTEKRGVKVAESTNPKDFYQFLLMMDDTAKRAKVRFFPRGYYQKLWDTLVPKSVARFYLAKAEGEPVASALLYDWAGTRIYAHAGAHQSLNRKANASVSLVWQAILDAKEAGLKQFDLWGVAPSDDPKHPWAGITKFKKGFGGEQVDYVGTWDIPLKKNKYRLYGLYRKLKGRE